MTSRHRWSGANQQHREGVRPQRKGVRPQGEGVRPQGEGVRRC